MNVLSVFLVAAKRLWNNKGLTLCSIAGLITAVALISSIPLYTDAANFKVLKDELSSDKSDATRRRPPFSFMYRYIGAWHGAKELEDYDPINEYMVRSVPGTIGLPTLGFVRHVKTDNFSMFPASEAAYIGLREPLGWVSLGFISDLQQHIGIPHGDWPAQARPGDEVVEVLISEDLAREIGVQPGEEFVMFKRADVARTPGQPAQAAEEARPTQITIHIAGIWEALDERDDFWFYSPKALANTLFVSEETFRGRISPEMPGEIYTAVWYMILDGEEIRTDDVPHLLGRINYANTRVTSLLPNTTLDISPAEALERYRWTTFVMTIMLYVFSIPILGLVLYFIGLISGLVVERQRGEIAILKSRGTGDFQVIGIYALEGLIIGVIGLAVGIVIGRQLAVVMGNTISFLTFGLRERLPVVITPRSLRFSLLGIGVALLASLWPAMRAARLTIVTYKRERARAMELPFWQRYFLDFLLLIPAGYGYYILKNRGTINILGGQVGGDPFNDPLLFLVPSLTIFAVSLFIIRIFPLVMEFLAWLTGQFVGALSIVLALRQLARVSKQYTGALLLLVLTLSLATFTASMARTLDQSLVDRMYYRVGADYQLSEIGELPEEEGAGGEAAAPAPEQPGAISMEPKGWMFIPVNEHLKVEGIRAATRVGAYPASVTIGRTTGRGTFYGVDRLDFPSVGFFRRDFSTNNLGVLMNRLALSDSAILVSPNFMADFALNAGDRVNITVSAWGERRSIEFIVADVIRYFPTYYPEQNNEYLYVGNLDYIFEQLGGMFPYDVWINTDPGADPVKIQDDLRELDIRVLTMSNSRGEIDKEQSRPERAGVFGILSVGFAAAALLTVLGFLLHSFISFRRRFIEFGVLRAIGLSLGQMLGFLGLEQIVLIAVGITSGTGLGIWVSQLFIPFLQVGTAKHIDVPPFVVLIAWDDIVKIYAVFAAMLLLAVAGMIWFLMRLRIFEAVKLGEAV
jgi:putative ABC transport system permease protein